MKKTNLVVLALSLSFATAYAQSGEQILNSDPINVDGYLAEDRPVTDGELEQIRSELNKQKTGTKLNKEKAKDLGKLTNQTEKLIDSQDEYIDQKIESTRAIKEFNAKYEENQKKLRCILEESDSEECEPYKNKYRKNKKVEVEKEVEQQVQVQQAAPVITAEAPSTGSAFEKIKLLPYAGGTTYSSEKEELEAVVSAGLRLESNITSRFSVGIGFNYSQFKTDDFGGSYGNAYQSGYNSYMPGYSAYNSGYPSYSREMMYKSMGLDLYGKFFITQGERFRPYLGAGLGYQKANLKYSDNQNYTFGASQYGGEEFNSGHATGTLMAGTEIMITRGFGINLELAYSKGLSMSSEDKMNPYNAPDQKRLQELGKEIVDANALSIFAGAVIVF